MNLYHIKRTSGTYGYGEYVAHVIRASSFVECRGIAAERSTRAAEVKAEWLLDKNSAIDVLAVDVYGIAGIVLSDFNSGA